jgi:hypothetical protein
MPDELPSNYTIIDCPNCKYIMSTAQTYVSEILLLEEKGFSVRQISFELDLMDDEVQAIINSKKDD